MASKCVGSVRYKTPNSSRCGSCDAARFTPKILVRFFIYLFELSYENNTTKMSIVLIHPSMKLFLLNLQRKDGIDNGWGHFWFCGSFLWGNVI